jgi:hypothetical protein
MDKQATTRPDKGAIVVLSALLSALHDAVKIRNECLEDLETHLKGLMVRFPTKDDADKEGKLRSVLAFSERTVLSVATKIIADHIESNQWEPVEEGMNRAFSLGQTYWQQADSESRRENRKSTETLDKFLNLRAKFVGITPSSPEARD